MTDKSEKPLAADAAQLQRAVFIAVLSFTFFIATMAAYYVWQSLLYFLLATAFLVVYIVMMVSLYRMRRR